MRRIRIGKDIAMRWTILTDGQPTDLANRKLLIEARAANGRVYELQYTTEKNTAIFTFFGKEQKFTGNYTITLWENKGEKGQNVVDKVNAFSLVRSTDEEDNSADAENNLEVETIDLGTTDFTLMGGGNNTVDIFSGTELMMVDGTEYFVVKKGEEMHIITAATMQSFFGNGQGGGSTTILDGSVTEAKLSDDVKNKINTASTDATNAKSAASNAQTSANNALSAASGALTAAEQAQTDAKTANSNAATASKLAADANTAANQAKETANAKQEKLTLEVLSNGNIKIGNLNGQTKEFMPATPSGDPMHYAYEALGAVYNSGEDVIAQTPWASLVDDADYNAKWGLNLIPDNATFVKNLKYNGVDREIWQMKHPAKTKLQIWVVADYASDGTKICDDTLVVKRSGMWYFLGLGDLTNAQMNDIFRYGHPSLANGAGALSKGRVIQIYDGVSNASLPSYYAYYNEYAEVLQIGHYPELTGSFYDFRYIKHIKHVSYVNANLGIKATPVAAPYLSCGILRFIKTATLSIGRISAKSMIKSLQSSNPSTAITLTFQSALYDRLMDTSTTLGAELVALLESKSNITFARGE